MFIFYLIAQVVVSQKINFLNQTENESIKVLLNVEQQSYIERLDGLGKILSVKFEGEDDSSSFCQPYYQGVTIHQAPSGFLSLVHELAKKDIDELTESDLYRGYNEKMSAYASSPEGIMILSSKGNVYLVSTESAKDIKTINATLPYFDREQQSPQLVYDEKSRYFFAFLNENVIKFQFFNGALYANLTTGWHQPLNSYRVIASNGWLYSAQEEQGLLIYEILSSGLRLAATITAYDLYDFQTDQSRIVDVGIQEDQLYILDSIHGITQFNIFFNGTFIKNGKLGLIKYSDCASFSVKGKTLLLIQSFKYNSEIIELYIQNDEYLELRKISTKSKLRRADIIDSNFAIIRGLHDHKIMLLKMAEQFLDNIAKRLDNYFFSGNLLGVEKFGNQNETIFAISPHGFYLFNYKTYPAIVICNSVDVDAGDYETQMIVTSTDCESKIEKSNDLLYCISAFNYEFEIKRPLLSPEDQQIYIYIAIALAVVVLILIACFFFSWKMHHNKIIMIKELQEKNKRNRRSISKEQA